MTRATWAAVSNIPDGELWAEHNAAKRQMLDLVRERTVAQLMRLGAGPLEVNAAAALLDPKALTIGFARRFATYKRATLIFRDQERLKRILNDPDRPVQIIFAGKAHPADEPGKAFIQAVYQMSQQPDFAGKIVFVEDYDVNIARHLVAGVDVWLNNPRRPLEASGTSGQKAGLNGVPNFSVLDGWWVEGYDGDNGWAIGEEREYPNEAAQDEADALSLYSTLENVIVPLFYERDAAGLPAGWLAMMRASIIDRRARLQLRPHAEGVREQILPAGGQFWAAGWMGRATPARASWPRGRIACWRAGPGLADRDRPGAAARCPWATPLAVQATLQPGALKPETWRWSWSTATMADGDLPAATVIPMRLTGGAGRRRVSTMPQRSTRPTAAPSPMACASGRSTRPAEPVCPASGEVGVSG